MSALHSIAFEGRKIGPRGRDLGSSLVIHQVADLEHGTTLCGADLDEVRAAGLFKMRVPQSSPFRLRCPTCENRAYEIRQGIYTASDLTRWQNEAGGRSQKPD